MSADEGFHEGRRNLPQPRVSLTITIAHLGQESISVSKVPGGEVPVGACQEGSSALGTRMWRGYGPLIRAKVR